MGPHNVSPHRTLGIVLVEKVVETIEVHGSCAICSQKLTKKIQLTAIEKF